MRSVELASSTCRHAIWPFRRRRKGSGTEKQLLPPPASEKSATRKASLSLPPSSLQQQPQPSTALVTSLTDPTSSAPVALTSSKSRRISRRRSDIAGTQQRQAAHAPPVPQRWQGSEKGRQLAGKENVAPPISSGSREDITALPVSYKLEHSPHLRPVDLDRPQIPYQFHPDTASLVSEKKQDTSSNVQRPRTLHSKRSVTEAGAPSRHSSRLSRRRDDAVREEEIRAMSAAIPIPKRSGDGPLRRESKKVKGSTKRDSQVSLPPEGSIHSAMSGITEQRGWEIGGFAAFNPRPSVRLSGTPQYVVSSLPQSPSGVLYRIDSIRDKEKAPMTRDSMRKRRTVGDEADDLDATDIRTIMERDRRRREKRELERTEKLEEKLRRREGRNRGDSDARRLRAEEDKLRVEQQIAAHGPLTPPTEVHPALRQSTLASDAVGLGIGGSSLPAEVMDVEHTGHQQQPRDLASQQQPEDPFTDIARVSPLQSHEDLLVTGSNMSLPLETPMDEPIIGTAQAVDLTQTNTPPLSPAYRQIMSSNTSQLTQALRQASVPEQPPSDLPPPPPIPVERRSSNPPQEARLGGWTSFFRRGGSNMRKVGRDDAAASSKGSFSNTSRDSMRNQPLPAHLVGTVERSAAGRSLSGTPVRTQSKFREELPGMATTSSIDSRTASLDSPTVASATRMMPQAVDIPGRNREGDRNDTPMSLRGHTAMSSSLASIDSEGEWLSGGPGKRQSHQSALSRSFGRRNDFNSSFEELGGDDDAEYMNRNRPRKISSAALIGASPDEESEEEGETMGESSADPLTVHQSMKRRPTLVQHQPSQRSREGLNQPRRNLKRLVRALSGRILLSEDSDIDSDESADESEDEGPQIERATSVNYVRHSRQFSAGSARLLDVASKGASTEKGRDTPEPGATSGAASDD